MIPLAILIIIISILFFAKKIIVNRLQLNYERSLLKGDRKKAIHFGKLYYHSLKEQHRKAKGIIDIEAKILDDFTAFNSHRFSIFI